MDSWILLKKEAENFFKINDYQKACDHYEEALTEIESKFDESKPELKVEAAKITSNISLMYLKISKEQNDESLLHASKIYAKKTITYNPKWIKGYLRLADVCKVTKDIDDILNAITVYLQDNKDVMNDAFKSLLQEVKYYTHKKVMILSPSWDSLKYKRNVYMVDPLGAGHFKDFVELINFHGNSMVNVSVLVRPGVYVGTYVFTDATIDIVGDCNIEINATTKAINKDPAIVFTNTSVPTTIDKWANGNKQINALNLVNVQSSTFVFIDCKISLRRISVYEKIIHHPIHAISCQNTDITLMQCAFYSKCSASFSCFERSKLNCKSCRSVGSFGGILTGNKSYASLTDCFISELTGIGVEASDETERISLKHCTITKCKEQGLVVHNGAVMAKIVDSHFEGNCILKPKEGSIQLKSCRALVKNTSVQNQDSIGIVIEGGSGNFHNVNIKNCPTGVLCQANVEIANCSISRCSNAGITICRHIKGSVILENNTITRCLMDIRRTDTSQMPVFKGLNRHVVITVPIMEVLEGATYENLRKSRRKNTGSLNIGPVGDVLEINKKAATICAHCGLCEFMVEDLKACGECKMTYYCSLECQQKAWKFHKPHCKSYVKARRAYKKQQTK